MKHLSHHNFGILPKVICIALIWLCLPVKSYAQQEEILLTFRHPAVGTLYINSLYISENETVLIPVLELFSLLEINYKPDKTNFTVQGNYITADNPYIINLSEGFVKLGKTTYPLTPADYKIGEMDFYLSPKVFEEVFGLNFTVNIDQLILSLTTSHTLPVESRKSRERSRSKMEGMDLNKTDYPLRYDRKRSILSGTMLDYSINTDISADAKSLGYSLTGGMELLGGDVQGTISGSNSTDGYNFTNVNGLRWRYAIRDNDFISGIMAGQTSTTGLQPLSIKGIALTNDPIEPRQMYDTYAVDGTTEPESEVEIYVNERLTDFKRADELGYYRFDVPIMYGTTRISLRIYTPSGKTIVSDRQMQVPFTFLPKGVVSYNVQAGKTEDYMSSSLANQWVAHGNIAMGLTKWLTASAGTQYLGNMSTMEFYTSLSARIAKQYLLDLDASPKNFYRLTGSVMYANNLNLNVIYTRFDGAGIYNTRNATDFLSTNMYFPFRVFGLSTGFRLSGEHYILPTSTQTMFRTDVSARIAGMDFRFNYRDNLLNSNNNTSFGQGLLTTGVTYTVARSPGVPVYVRGMYVRAQTAYSIHGNYFEQSEMSLSRTLFKTGRLDFSFAYNHVSKIVNARAGLTLDLSTIRSVTSAFLYGNRFAARQSLTGSLGWDVPNERIVTSNRQQVGRSSAAVILYVDNNNSGRYDKGDQLLPYRAVKLDQTSTVQLGRDSILRLTQLQSYYKYNLSINRNAIPDPTLVPIIDNFSFITDPNQYKQIEIPFYRGGIIEGEVLVEREGKVIGQGGLRLLVKAVGKEFETVVRTMSDGNFYVMDLAPGKYTMEVDPIQLGFLDVHCEPEKINFEIRALSEGDYLVGLKIKLIPTIVAKKEVSVVSEIQPVVTKDSIVTEIREPLKIAQKDTLASVRSDSILAPLKQPTDTIYKGLVLPKYLGEPLILRNKLGKYSINFGTFSQLKQTNFLVDLINKKSPDKTLIINSNGHYSVRIGYFDSRKEAEAIKASMIFKKNLKK